MSDEGPAFPNSFHAKAKCEGRQRSSFCLVRGLDVDRYKVQQGMQRQGKMGTSLGQTGAEKSI